MKKYFDLLAPVYEKIRSGSQKVANKLEGIVEFRSTDVVVDLGGGTGAVARFLAPRVGSITVVDPSEKMIAQCRKHAEVSCLVGVGEHLPLESGSVDKFILVDAFHHIPGQVAAIQEMKRVLRPGGRIIMAEFNPLTFSVKAIILYETVLRFGSTFYRPSVLAALFSDHGFETQLFDEERKDYYLIATKK